MTPSDQEIAEWWCVLLVAFGLAQEGQEGVFTKATADARQ